MKNAYEVIKTVSLTEKSSHLVGEEGQYTFVVAKEANKREIKHAVERLFNTEVASVNVANVRGKKRRNRHGIGKKADWKKAIVKLKDGAEPIDLL